MLVMKSDALFRNRAAIHVRVRTRHGERGPGDVAEVVLRVDDEQSCVDPYGIGHSSSSLYEFILAYFVRSRTNYSESLLYTSHTQSQACCVQEAAVVAIIVRIRTKLTS